MVRFWLVSVWCADCGLSGVDAPVAEPTDPIVELLLRIPLGRLLLLLLLLVL